MAATVAGIRARAPKAKVVVVGYPQIIPSRGSCPDLLPLAIGDYPFARRVSAGLAAAVKRGARDATFVDLFGPSAGHDICSSDPWINGANTDPARALAFHPFAAELNSRPRERHAFKTPAEVLEQLLSTATTNHGVA